MGYDGKGQFVVRDAANLDAAWDAIGGPGLIFEKFQSFSAASFPSWGPVLMTGQSVFYPLSANVHGGGILALQHLPPSRIDALSVVPKPT